MANYRKSFSFREGLQVDNDNFVINDEGRVGIGTTDPDKTLDVYGTIRSSGLTTTRTLGVIESSEFHGAVTTKASLVVDDTVKIESGIITSSTSTGVVTYYGDGGKLLNLPSSQWVDIDVGLGFTSIYSSGNVGVDTDDPRNTFQVGGNPYGSSEGVAIGEGNVKASGIISATSFIGFGSGITQIDASNISLGTLSEDRLPSSYTVSGIITATQGFSGSLTGVASTAESLTGSPNIGVSTITALRINTGVSSVAYGDITNLNVGGIATIGVLSATNSTIGILTITDNLKVEHSNSHYLVVSEGKVGLGTDSPSSDVEIYRNEQAAIEIISRTGEALIAIGSSPGLGTSAINIKYGQIAKSSQIVHKDEGALISQISGSNNDISKFEWHDGGNIERMVLTHDGKLGVGTTLPKEVLDVNGIATFRSSVHVQSDLTVHGNINGLVNLPSVVDSINLNTATGVSTLNNINITNSTTTQFLGVGTDKKEIFSRPLDLDVRGKNAIIGILGINTTTTSFSDVDPNDDVPSLNVYGNTKTTSMGINTAFARDEYGEDVELRVQGSIHQAYGGFSLRTVTIAADDCSIGIGTTSPNAAVDFAGAGTTTANRADAYMVVPNVTNNERTNLLGGSGNVSVGAIVYVTDSGTNNGFWGYKEDGWVKLHA